MSNRSMSGTDGYPSADPAAQLLSSNQFPSFLERAILFFSFFLMRGGGQRVTPSSVSHLEGSVQSDFADSHSTGARLLVWPENYRRSCW